MRKKWLTPREAAELIGVTDVSIRGWANAGLITYRILGKSMSVLKEDVLRVGKEKGRIFEATLSVDDYVAMLRKSEERIEDKIIELENRNEDILSSFKSKRHFDSFTSNLTTAVNSLLRIDVVPNAISERNRNLIKDVLLGESNQELAEKYGISDTMVKNVIKDVFHHLGEIYTKVLAWQESEELYNLVFELMDVINILLQRLDIYKQYAPEPEYMDWMDFEHRSKYDVSLSEIGLSSRVCQTLRNADVYTLGDLVVFSERDLCKFRNMGSKGIEEIKSLVAQRGMHLGMRIKASPLRANWTYKLYYIQSNVEKIDARWQALSTCVDAILSSRNDRKTLQINGFCQIKDVCVYSPEELKSAFGLSSKAIDELGQFLENNCLSFKISAKEIREIEIVRKYLSYRDTDK